MKVVNIGNIADAFRFDNLPATGIVIEATPEELKLLPNLAYKDVTISGHVGNKAAMRDACANIAEYARAATCHTDDSHLLGYLYQIERWAESALAAPPRNCDVGTDEEQSRRYEELCDRHTCGSRCSASGCPMYEHDCSPFAWGQMPYEEGGTK